MERMGRGLFIMNKKIEKIDTVEEVAEEIEVEDVKYVLNFGSGKQIMPVDYVLEDFQREISKKDFLEKEYEVDVSAVDEHFKNLRAAEALQAEALMSLSVEDIEKLKKLIE
jgi:hypothetical protein